MMLTDLLAIKAPVATGESEVAAPALAIGSQTEITPLVDSDVPETVTVTPSLNRRSTAFSDELLNAVNRLLPKNGFAALRSDTTAKTVLPTDGDEADEKPVAHSHAGNQQLLDALLMACALPNTPPTPVVPPEDVQSGNTGTLTLSGFPVTAPAVSSDEGDTTEEGSPIAVQTTPRGTSAAGMTPSAMRPVAAALLVAAPVSGTRSEPLPLAFTAALTAGQNGHGEVTRQEGDALAAQQPALKLDSSDGNMPQQLQSALGERLQIQMRDQVQHATIRLEPPDMGKINISLQFEPGRLQVHINASQGEVYRALQQVSNDLRQSLTDHNVMQVDVQVSQQQPGQQQSGQGRQSQTQPDFIMQGAQLAPEEPSHTDHDESVLLTI